MLTQYGGVVVRGVLGNREYRHLFSAQVVALVGTGLLTVALGLLAYDLAPDSAGAVVGTALTIKIVAYAILSPVIAALAERLPRRGLLVGADLIRAAVAAVLPFVDAVWQIYALIFVLQAASAAFTPAFQAVIPSVLPEERDYTRALSLSRLAYDLESLLSPAVAAALLTVIGYRDLFAGTLLGFLASALLVVTIRIDVPRADGDAGASFWQKATYGTRRFWSSPQLRALLALDLAVAGATAVVLVNTVVIVRGALGLGSSDVAVALAAYGAGSMVVALAIPRVLDRTADRNVMLPAGLALAVGVGLSAGLLGLDLPTTVTWVTLLVLWCLLGAATSMILTPSARLLRRHSTEQDRAALFAAQFSLSHACYLVTYPIAGWVGSYVGLASASIVLAVIATIAAIVALRAWPTGPHADDGASARTRTAQ